MLAANMRHADRLDDVRNSRRRARKSWRLESSSHPWLGIGGAGKVAADPTLLAKVSKL
jgi:hypothetical protein